ncbi:MAG TPA: transcriptional regulator, partial [Tissierellales bacterium]|nr:transcriptional regulator [Tissierellales bacterium]
MLKEKDYGKQLEYRSNELETLINSITEGILIIDEAMRVASVNAYLSERMDLEQGRKYLIREILPESVLDKLSSKGFSGELGPVNIRGEEYIIQSNPIISDGGRGGYVLVLSDFGKMKQSVLKSRKENEIVTFEDILGESEAIKTARRQAIQVAGSDASVLIFGETGTGKEIFARAIHFAGNRSEQTFQPVNCGAIPENLMESEFFGYRKGAFTGAESEREGFFQAADGGTLFLDEVGEIPLQLQSKFLRVLQEKQYERVGEERTRTVNVRIIAATNRDLKKEVAAGRFREDLFYRLAVVPIRVPPLR